MAEFVPIDFGGLAAALLARADELVARWLPHGVERNGRWYVGDFDGADGDSANVNLRSGQWIDNGGDADDCGGDLLSLYKRIYGHATMVAAARELMRDLGLAPVSSQQACAAAGAARAADDGVAAADAAAAEPAAPADPAHAPVRPARTERWQSVLPVPSHAPVPTRFRRGFQDTKTGAWLEFDAVQTWAYEFEGQRYGYVARFERTDSKGAAVKDFLPLTWCQDTQDARAGQRWHGKQWAAPRPLYVPATLLSGTPADVPVVVVEGEKCALVGHQLVGHEFDFVSWPGGCKAWSMAQWAWLQGRTVYLWPDVDAQRVRLTRAEKDAGADPSGKPVLPADQQPGMQAMVGIGALLAAEHGCTVYLCQVPAPDAGRPGWDIADAAAEGWDAPRVRAFIRGAMAFVAPQVAPQQAAPAGAAAGGGGASPPSTPSSAGAGAWEDEPDAWRRKLLTSEKGAIKSVRENAVLALDGLPEQTLPGITQAADVVAFNEFTNDVVKLKPAPWGTPAGVWDETDELELGNWLVRQHRLPSMPRGTLEEAVAMVAKRHRFHPVRQQLAALHGRWDGHKRLATWLRRCCLVEDEWDDADPLQQYLARVGTWLVMAICARVLTPGCKFDYMVIFEGAQGVGKSTLARLLGGDYFADTGLVLGDKDSYQNLQGVLVYEWGELDSLTKSEVTKVKQFISSMKDRFRASFDRRAKDYPRQVVFIGTTNEDHYLVDPTGNRRMWPVRVTRAIDLDWFRDNRDQLFAEALACVEAGERFHPTTREQRELFEPQQQQRQIENAIASAVVRYLYDEQQRVGVHGENGALVNEISVLDLLSRLGISVDKQTQVLQRQATAALRHAGWVRVRASKPPRPWVFRRPQDDALARAGASDESINRPTQGDTPAGDADGCPF